MRDHAQKIGELSMCKRVLAILAVSDGTPYSVIAATLKVSKEAIRLCMNTILFKGVESLKSKKPSGRPPKLTKRQKKELESLIIEGPTKAGFPSACWRSPMIQTLIYEKFGVKYNVFYISELLKNMGFLYQKAKFVSDHKAPEKREKWPKKTWPEIF